MKAIMKLKPEPGLTLKEVPIPEIKSNEVLVKIKATAICGTDLHIYHWDAFAQKTIHLPLIIGHEFMGEIASVGAEISHLKVGDRVSGEGHITCGFCRNCREGKQYLCPNTEGIGSQRNGAFAEYLALPASNIIPLPKFISDEVAAILDPLGNAVHTTLIFDIIGENILITGAGPIGLLSVTIAKHIGAKQIVITDINPFRLELAKQFGANKTINMNIETNPLKILLEDEAYSDGFPVGLEMSGAPSAIHLQLEALMHGASLALLGIPKQDVLMDCHKIIFKGLTVKGIYGRKMYETWDKSLSLLQSGLDISAVITHHFQAEDFEQAFKTIEEGNTGKVILHW